uniref:Uncharacterized protein n=1 Tax=Acrobeloides nanus TaxID=290746 RepID=A0A914BXU6_9BILA
MPLTKETQNKFLPKKPEIIKAKKSKKKEKDKDYIPLVRKTLEKAAYPWKHKKEVKKRSSPSPSSSEDEKRHRRKRHSSSKFKDKHAKKKKRADSSSSSEDTNPELFKPISSFINNREKMMDHVFYSLKKDEIKEILPNEFKKKSMEELRKICVGELEGMSKARILAVLAGKDLEESSGEEEEDEPEPSNNVSPVVSQPSSPGSVSLTSSTGFESEESPTEIKEGQEESRPLSADSNENIEALLPIYRSFSPYTGEHEVKEEMSETSPEPEKPARKKAKEKTSKKKKVKEKSAKKNIKEKPAKKKVKEKMQRDDLEEGEITTSESDGEHITDISSETDQPTSSRQAKKSESDQSDRSPLLQIRIQNVRKDRDSPEAVIFYEEEDQEEDGEVVIRLESRGEGVNVVWKDVSEPGEDEQQSEATSPQESVEPEDEEKPFEKAAADSTTIAENELGDCPEIEFDED